MIVHSLIDCSGPIPSEADPYGMRSFLPFLNLPGAEEGVGAHVVYAGDARKDDGAASDKDHEPDAVARHEGTVELF